MKTVRTLAPGGRDEGVAPAAKPEDQPSGRWLRHPIGAAILRGAVVLIPVAVAMAAGLVVGWNIGGHGVGAELLRIAAAAVVTILVIVVMERLVRPLLPLAMLLRLSLVFPDHAPSRYSVALRSTSVKKLQHWARTTQHDDGQAALAEKVVTLAAALNTHDRRTRGHSDRSRAMAELMAVEMGLSEAEVNEVRWGAFLHDIGKILVPASLLNKPSKPTPSEWEVLKRHPVDGGELVEPLRDFLGSGVEAVSGHHENFDGSGYPRGLKGHEIAVSARIVCVADSFDVMTAVRSYNKPMKVSEARKELVRHSGTQFDPAVIRALFDISLGRLHWSVGAAAWMAELPFLGVLPRAVAQAASLVSGPTISVSTLSGVAALSLGSVMVQAPTTLAPAAMASHASPGVAVTQADHHGAMVTGPALLRPDTAQLSSTNGQSAGAATTAKATPESGNSVVGQASGGTGTSASQSGQTVEAGPVVLSESTSVDPAAVAPAIPPTPAAGAISQVQDLATSTGDPVTLPTLPPQAADPTLPAQATEPTLPAQASVNPRRP
jgi:hypothetical protein